MHDTHQTCSTCGTPEIPSGPTQRVLIGVVDQGGRRWVCTLCAVRLLSRVASSGDVTVFVASSAMA